MEYIIELAGNVNKLRYIMMIELEFLYREKMFNILNVAGEKVVHANHRIAFFQKTVAEMRTEKTGSSCNKYALHLSICSG
jgi:hypothetical protein